MEKPGQVTLVKYFMGECDAAEEKLITLYLAMEIDKDYVTACLKEAAERMKDEPIADWTEADQLNAWRKFGNRKSVYPQIAIKRTGSWKRMAVAATILISVSVGLLYFKDTSIFNNSTVLTKVHHIQTDREPGSNKAVLILANGQKIDLNNAQNGAIAVQAKIQITKAPDGKLIYAEDQEHSSNQAVEINTLTVPKGGQYKLTLSDGSNVWLNAASSLQFPARFTGNSREVILSGEAYFEVAKNAKMPFRVKLSKMEVEVLGTHFNIMAYDDEPAIETTLLEGSVKLSNANDQQILKPGQEGILADHTNEFVVKPANMERVIAWKNGQFFFTDENIQSISRKLSRWYDISITDNRKNKNLTYTGSISKYKNVSEVLKMLELTGTLHYKIEDGRVTLM